MIAAHPAVEHRDGWFGAAADCARMSHGAPVVHISAPARARRPGAARGAGSTFAVTHRMIEPHAVILCKIVTFCRVQTRSLVRKSAVLFLSATSNSVPGTLGARHADAHTRNAALLERRDGSSGRCYNWDYTVCDNNVLGRHSWFRPWKNIYTRSSISRRSRSARWYLASFSLRSYSCTQSR